MTDSLGVSLGVGGLLGRLGLGLLLSTVGGEGGVSDGVSDGLLCGADVGVCGVCESVGHLILLVCMCFECLRLFVLCLMVFVKKRGARRLCFYVFFFGNRGWSGM